MPGNTLLAMAELHAIWRAKHEVDLRDGSIHALHLIGETASTARRYLRALETPAGTLIVFDLRHLAPALADELPTHVERDVPGLVKYTLRGLYATGAELQRAVEACHLAFAELPISARAAA